MAYFMDKYNAADKGFVVSVAKDQEIEAGGKKSHIEIRLI